MVTDIRKDRHTDEAEPHCTPPKKPCVTTAGNRMLDRSYAYDYEHVFQDSWTEKWPWLFRQGDKILNYSSGRTLTSVTGSWGFFYLEDFDFGPAIQKWKGKKNRNIYKY